jgi:hypothetical protein
MLPQTVNAYYNPGTVDIPEEVVLRADELVHAREGVELLQELTCLQGFIDRLSVAWSGRHPPSHERPLRACSAPRASAWARDYAYD